VFKISRTIDLVVSTMTMNLTEWWQAFGADLERIESKGVKGILKSKSWLLAKQLVESGVHIEDGLFEAKRLSDSMEVLMPSMGKPYKSTLDQNPQYLPNVTNPEDLLFALAYHRHLVRYAKIDSSNYGIVLQGIKAKRELVKEGASRLKTRIDTWLGTKESVVRTAFPELDQFPGSLWEQLTALISELPLAEKIIKQFEADVSHCAENDPVQVFDRLDKIVKYEEKTLREIAGKIASSAKNTAKAQMIDQEIEGLVEHLNSPFSDPQYKIQVKDFDDFSAEALLELADKTALISNIVNIHKAMALYRQQRNKGIVTVMELDVFGPIVKFLSTTFLRHLIHDCILLAQESEKLQEELDLMVDGLETKAIDQNVAKINLQTLLVSTSLSVKKIERKSIYEKDDEIDEARGDFQAVLDGVTLKMGFAN
jgi:hypothetical protein